MSLIEVQEPGNKEWNDLQETALAFVAPLVKEEEVYSSPAIHPHGQIFCKTLLTAFKEHFSRCNAYSAKPAVAFPRGRQLLIPGQVFRLKSGSVVRNVPYINVTPIKQLGIGLLILARILHWGRQCRLYRHRIVFSFNLSVPPAIFTLIAARLAKAKAVVYLGDISTPGLTTPNKFWYKFDAFLQHKILKYFDGYVVVADCMARDFFPGKAYLRVEGGVSGSLLQQADLCFAKRRYDPSVFSVVATGSLEEHNGFREIVNAFRTIPDDHCRLFIAGRGSLQTFVEQAAREDSRIEFLGYLQQEKLLSLHAKADVLVNMRVSRPGHVIYGFPSKTLEYLVSGIPMITTCVGNIEEEYAKYCYVLKEESVAGLAIQIQEVKNTPLIHRMQIGAQAREFMRTNKTWAAQCDKIQSYLQELLQ